MTTRMIRRFVMTGEYAETKLIQTRSTVRSFLINMMKDEGYVPLLDVDPVWQNDYRGGERYLFTYTIQGVFVGKEEAWQIDGVMDGKLIRSNRK